MSDIPYMPLYVDDFEAATVHLTIAEDGIYNRLMRLCWRTNGCTVPSDPKWLIRQLRLSEEQYNDVAKPIIDEFFTVKNGRLFQRRLQKEFEKINHVVSVRKEAGKRGGDAKALKSNKKRSSKTDSKLIANGKQNSSIHNHTYNHIKNTKKEELFDKFWTAYPDRKGSNAKKAAKDKFFKLIDSVDPELIITGAKEYSKDMQGKDREFVAMATTWLNQSRWTDYEPEPDDLFSDEPKDEEFVYWKTFMDIWKKDGKWLTITGSPPPDHEFTNVPKRILKIYGVIK